MFHSVALPECFHSGLNVFVATSRFVSTFAVVLRHGMTAWYAYW